jgi:hypothetical protein
MNWTCRGIPVTDHSVLLMMFDALTSLLHRPQRVRHPLPQPLLLTRRARTASGTATQCTRRNDLSHHQRALLRVLQPRRRDFHPQYFVVRTGVTQGNLSHNRHHFHDGKRPAHIQDRATLLRRQEACHNPTHAPPPAHATGLRGRGPLDNHVTSAHRAAQRFTPPPAAARGFSGAALAPRDARAHLGRAASRVGGQRHPAAPPPRRACCARRRGREGR